MDDDTKTKLIECCKDMSVEEIASVIQASSHGGAVKDPMVVAALIKSWS